MEAEGGVVRKFRNTPPLRKNRALPVWRQILGTQGEWHEGGEYVGIDIGHAIAHNRGTVPELDDPDIREVPAHSWRVIYQMRGNTVFIVTLVHRRRAPVPEDLRA